MDRQPLSALQNSPAQGRKSSPFLMEQTTKKKISSGSMLNAKVTTSEVTDAKYFLTTPAITPRILEGESLLLR